MIRVQPILFNIKLVRINQNSIIILRLELKKNFELANFNNLSKKYKKKFYVSTSCT